MRRISLLLSIVLGCGLCYAAQALASADFTRLRALGDSLTMGTQGGLISDYRTQPRAWAALVALQAGTPFRLPLLEKMNLIGMQRRRDYPNYGRIDCYAYNGASVDDLYQKLSVDVPASSQGWGYSHLDLIMAGRPGISLVDAVLDDNATFVIGFIGSNDYLNKIMAKGTILENIPFVNEIEPLDGSGMRPQHLFWRDFNVVVTRLWRPDRGMCFGTMPTLPNIPGILNKAQLTEFAGPNSLPPDCYTNYVVAAAVRSGLWPGTIFADDVNHFTPEEIENINTQILGYNQTIRELAANPRHPFAVVESPIQMPEITSGEFRVNGWRINAELFANNVGKPRASIMSTDGVHLSDIGQAMTALAFIRAINDYYGTSIPEPSEAQLTTILDGDPFVDNDGDGRIEGLDSEAFYLSLNFVYGQTLTGDTNETPRAAKVLQLQASPEDCGSVTGADGGPEFFEDHTLILTAEPAAGQSSFFSHWAGDVPESSRTTNPLVLVMDQDRNVTAVFACGPDITATPTPSPTPPPPPTSTLTQTPHVDPTGTYTPTRTATPVPSGVDLELRADFDSGGSRMMLVTMRLANHDATAYPVALYVAVEVYGTFYFYPAFAEAALPLASFDLPANFTMDWFTLVELHFPDPLGVRVQATWYAAMIHTVSGDLVGPLASSAVTLE